MVKSGFVYRIFHCFIIKLSFTQCQVKEFTEGKGADVIMEAVGGKVFNECLKR